MLKSPAAAEKVKAKNIPPGFNALGSEAAKANKKKSNAENDNDEAPAPKKKKVELVFEDEMKAANEGGANATNGSNNTKSMKSELISIRY